MPARATNLSDQAKYGPLIREAALYPELSLRALARRHNVPATTVRQVLSRSYFEIDELRRTHYNQIVARLWLSSLASSKRMTDLIVSGAARGRAGSRMFYQEVRESRVLMGAIKVMHRVPQVPGLESA